MANDLDLAEMIGAITRPDASARQTARAAQAVRRGGPSRLEDLADWLAGVQGTSSARPLDRVRMLALAGDHGVAAGGVSSRPAGATAQWVRDTVAGRSAAAVLAAALDVGVRVAAVSLDEDESDLPAAAGGHFVRRGSGQVHREPAMSRAETEAALRAGMALVDQEVDAGADLLVVTDLGRGAGVPAAALVGLLTSSDASVVTSRGGGLDDALWMRRCAAVRDTMHRGRPVLGDHTELLRTVGGPDLAATAGALLRSAARRTPVLLDGVVTAAAALVARRIAFRAGDWWLAAHRVPGPAHDLALERLTLVPLLDLGIGQEDGTGALLAVPLLRAAAGLTPARR